MPVNNKTCNNEHQWDGCMCLSCSAFRDDQHYYNPLEDLGWFGLGRICIRCGKVNFGRSILSYYIPNRINNGNNSVIVDPPCIYEIDNMLKTLNDNISRPTNNDSIFYDSKVILVTLNYFLQHFAPRVPSNCLAEITNLRGKKAEYYYDPYPHIPECSPVDVSVDGVKIDFEHVNRLRKERGARHEIFNCLYLSNLAEQELTRRLV